jgi:hypothetical protein
MGAGEHQREQLVGNVARRRGRELLGHHSPFCDGALAAAPPPQRIDHLAPRHGDESRVRVVGDSARGPIDQRGLGKASSLGIDIT